MNTNNLKIVSFNLDNNIEADKLVKSCSKFGYSLEFIGQGHGFKNFRQLKIDLLLEEIQRIEAEYIMYTDGLDSWFLRGDILDVFLQFNKKVVVSANRDHYPHTNLYTYFPRSNTSFKYICSSQFIGTKEYLIKTLQRIKNNYAGYIDQEGWNYCYAKTLLPWVSIDRKCNLFLNMTNVDLNEIEKTGNGFRLVETDVYPCSIHFGGPKGEDKNAKNMKDFYNISI